MRRKDINEEVEKTLQALDDFEQVEANPYFMTRLMQRIENEKKEEESRPSFSWVTLWQPALFAMLIIVNAYTFYQFSSHSTTDDAGLSTLMDEYSIEQNTSNQDYASTGNY